MTGEEHFAEAERQLENASDSDEASAPWHHTRAQIHATLALAAFSRPTTYVMNYGGSS